MPDKHKEENIDETADEAVEEVEERAEEALDSVEEAVEEVEEAVEDAGDSITAESVELRHEHEIHVKQAVDEVEQAIDRRRERIEEKTDEVLGTVEETVGDVEETVEEESERLSERARERTEKVGETLDKQRETAGEHTEKALQAFDDSINRLLSEALDTETRVTVYITLRKKDGATLGEVAEESGLYPENVASVLEELEDEDIVESEDGLYRAVPPTDLVAGLPKRVGSWVGSFMRREKTDVSKLAEGELGISEDDEKPEVRAEYDKENDEVTVRVEDAGGSDYLNILLDGEVGHTFHFPSEGDEVTLKRSSGEKVTAESGYLRHEAKE